MKRVKRPCENSVRRWEKPRQRDKKERPSGAPVLVILTQFQHWNMATMWTLSKSFAPVSVQPIRGDKVWGRRDMGRVWERMSSKCASTAGECTAEEQHLQEIWITNRSRETGWTFLNRPAWFQFNPLEKHSYNCHTTDITAHKYYVVGQNPTLP